MKQLRQQVLDCNRCQSIPERIRAPRVGRGRWKNPQLIVVADHPEIGDRCVHGYAMKKYPQTGHNNVEKAINLMVEKLGLERVYTTFAFKCPPRDGIQWFNTAHFKMAGACRRHLEAEFRLMNPECPVLFTGNAIYLGLDKKRSVLLKRDGCGIAIMHDGKSRMQLSHQHPVDALVEPLAAALAAMYRRLADG